MKRLCEVCIVFILGMTFGKDNLMAQQYRTNSSSVHFFSDAPMEDIEATNTSGRSAMNISSGDVVFSVPIRSFMFEKSLMQEHFNENYMESDQYPEAIFKGNITGYDPLSPGWQKAYASGIMEIHGQTRNISVEGRIRIGEESVQVEAQFPVRLADYKIKIPKVVFYNIAEIVDVTIAFNYEKID